MFKNFVEKLKGRKKDPAAPGSPPATPVPTSPAAAPVPARPGNGTPIAAETARSASPVHAAKPAVMSSGSAPSSGPMKGLGPVVLATKSRPVLEDDIRRRAYHLWEAAGRPPGDGSHFWVEAERELKQAK